MSAAALLCAGAAAAAASPPHVLFVVSDDLGYHDVSFHGSEVQTPFMDSLVKTGVHLANYYGHSICTPSRSSLLTGRYASHTGLQHSFLLTGTDTGLPLKFKTMGDHMKEAGYRTHMVGKWHLGFQSPAYTPLRRGFETYFGYLSGGEDYYTHETGGFVDLHDGDKPALNYSGVYSTELFANRTIDVVNAHPDAADPLFVLLTFQSVHSPLEAPKEYVERYSWITSSKRRTLAAMTTCMDDSLRRIHQAYEARGMSGSLLTVMVADNGGPPYVANSNWPMRGGKWTMWEGGTHLVGFAHHGGGLLPAKNYTGLMHHCDWVPTLLAAAGAPMNDTVLPAPDGVSQWAELTAEADRAGPRQHVLLNVDQTDIVNASNDPDGWSGYAGVVAMQSGLKYKLVLGTPGIPNGWCWPDQNSSEGSGRSSEDGFVAVNVSVGGSPMPDPSKLTCGHSRKIPQNTTGPILFDLTHDPRESADLAAHRPDVVGALMALLQPYVDSAVVPLNESPEERERDSQATAAAKAAKCWVPWQH